MNRLIDGTEDTELSPEVRFVSYQIRFGFLVIPAVRAAYSRGERELGNVLSRKVHIAYLRARESLALISDREKHRLELNLEDLQNAIDELREWQRKDTDSDSIAGT